MNPIKTSFFVDGSNMAGSLKLLNVRVNDYQAFFNAILLKTTKVISQSLVSPSAQVPVLQLKRVSWYALADIDRVDTATEWFTQKMSEDFFNFKDLSESYRQLVFERTQGQRMSIKELDTKAFHLFLGQVLTWYKSQVDFVDGLANFYRAVREKTSFIDIVECGHWKVDFVNRVVNEKELDTRMAVDIVTIGLDSDVILLMSGDADFIPSVRYVKQQGKQVGIVQLTDNTRQSIISNRLKMVADFVVYLDKAELP